MFGRAGGDLAACRMAASGACAAWLWPKVRCRCRLLRRWPAACRPMREAVREASLADEGEARAAQGSRPHRTHHPHQLRRHRQMDRLAHDRQPRHGRSRTRHARKPHHLEDQSLGHGPRHQSRLRRSRCRHAQEPHRPPAGPALLRPERRSRPLGQRPQLSGRRQRSHRQPRSSPGDILQPLDGVATTHQGQSRRQRRSPRRLARAKSSARAKPPSA